MSRDRGNSQERWRYSYDGRGRFAEARYSERNAWTLYTFHYDGADKLTEVLSSDTSGTPLDVRRFAYWPAGALRSETVTWFAADGQPERSWIKNFDTAGRLLDKEYRHERWPFSSRWTYRYDSDGRLVTEASFDSRGRTLTLTETTWDQEGRKLSERSSGRAIDPGYQVLYEYDERGRLLETVRLDLEGRYLSRELRRYNTWGDLVESAQFNPDGSLISRTRTDLSYDEHGNWIESQSFATNNAAEQYDLPGTYARRTIEYFP
jgi:YD repeat-containing protein